MKTPYKKERDECSSSTIQQVALMLGLFAFLVITLQASQPSWWLPSGAVNGSTPKDSLAVNEGQLKKMTFEAIQVMNTNLTGGAGTPLNTMATTWSNTYVASGFTTNDYQAIRVGQLKYIADMVYAPLITNGYMSATPTWLHTNSTVDSNVANIGQLKQVFAFELSAPQIPTISPVIFSGTNATLTWSDPVISIQNYTIQGSTNGGATWSTLSTVSGTSYSTTVTGLTLGANYIFQMKANNSAGSSSYSVTNAAPIITLATPVGATLVP